MSNVRPPLQNVFLHVTKACNLRCAYCYFSADRALPNELSSTEFATLWPELVELAPRKVIFTGGEPLVRADLVDLLSGLREADAQHRIIRCLNTNGHFLTKHLAQACIGLVDEFRVSLDALTQRNDALRGAGNFAAAVNALDLLYAHGFEPKVLITVTADSLPDLEELLCFLFQRKITRINVNSFRPIGRGAEHAEWLPAEHEIRQAMSRARRRCYPDEPTIAVPAPPQAAKPNCGVGQFLNIMPNGDVFPCHVLTDDTFRCGNLRESSLLEICRQEGLLARLGQLNFSELAREDEAFSALAQPDICLGSVYAQTKQAAAWSRHLPQRCE